MTSPSSNNPSSCLTSELWLSVAEFLSPQELLAFQCVSSELASLETDALWKRLCERRWEPWPRYRLTPQRLINLDTNHADKNWKQRYLWVEPQATRTRLTTEDLTSSTDMQWFLSFVLSGVRGEGRSDFMPITFLPNGQLMVPGHPPLPYRIVVEEPPPSDHIRSTLRGDQPFSTTHYLQISDFPPHFITRKQSTAEWYIVNENVLMVSTAK